MSERVVWVCDGCGKASGAKKRPQIHKRWRDRLEDDEPVAREQFYCGVFVRHLARRDDPKLSPLYGQECCGKPTGEEWPIYDDPNAGIPPAHE